MMHCTMDDLLALRAGEASVWAREHAGTCAACQAELEALYQRIARLKALPALRPGRDRWPAVRDAVRAARRRRLARWGVWSLATAAVLAGVLTVGPLWSNRLDAAELARVKRQSAALEQELERYDPDARVTSGRSAALAALLEDRIALIDGELTQPDPRTASSPANLVDLWRQRVDLMQQLVSVREAHAGYEGL